VQVDLSLLTLTSSFSCVRNCLNIFEVNKSLISCININFIQILPYFQVSFHVCMPLDIAVQHHMHIIGPGGVGIKQIMHMTGATVSFPDPANHAGHRQHTIQLGGTMASVIAARLQLLVGEMLAYVC